jgi:hypothetical protein
MRRRETGLPSFTQSSAKPPPDPRRMESSFKGRLFRINAVSEDKIQGAIGHLGWHDGIVAIS